MENHETVKENTFQTTQIHHLIHEQIQATEAQARQIHGLIDERVRGVESLTANLEHRISILELGMPVSKLHMARVDSGLYLKIIKPFRRVINSFRSFILRLRLSRVRHGNTTQAFALGADKKKIVIAFENTKGSRTLAINIPSPTSPNQLGLSQDNRRLGIGLIELKIVHILGSSEAHLICFNKALLPGIINRTEGLSDSELWGTWSSGDVLILEFCNPLPERFLVHLEAFAFGPNIGMEFIAHLLGQSRNSLTGAEGDIDELMHRVEEEVLRWKANDNFSNAHLVAQQ